MSTNYSDYSDFQDFCVRNIFVCAKMLGTFFSDFLTTGKIAKTNNII